MIDIKQLTVAYEGKTVIDNLSLTLKEGLVHGLVGMNGSGKTTLLNTVFGFKKSLSGNILLDNRNIKRWDIAYLEAENFFYSNITGLEYLQIFSNDLSDLPTWNELLQLPLDDLVEYYSTGMKKKLAFLAIIKLNRDILILDEPFNGLDIETTELVKKIIKILRGQGKTILLTSHVFELLMHVCDTVHLLEKGCITKSVEKPQFDDFHVALKAKIDKNQDSILEKLF
jgi:ABC-2 type transport system ATP-binding protein